MLLTDRKCNKMDKREKERERGGGENRKKENKILNK